MVERPPSAAVRLEHIKEPKVGDSLRSASCVSRRMAASAETASTMALLMSAQLPIAARTSSRDAVPDPHLLHGPGPETNRRCAVHSLPHLGACQRGIGDRPGRHSAHPTSRRSQVLPSAFSPYLSDDQPTPSSLRRSTASAACRMACPLGMDKWKLAEWHIDFEPGVREPTIKYANEVKIATVHGDETESFDRELLIAKAPTLRDSQLQPSLFLR